MQAAKRENNRLRKAGFSPVWLIPCACLILLPFVYALAFCFPRGDDFDEACKAMFLFDLPGAVYETGRSWLTWSGRYAYHFLAVFLGRAAHWRAAAGLAGALLLALYFQALFLTGQSLGMRLSGAALFALLGLCAILCFWRTPGDFYLFTDMLTICLQGAAALLFFALLSRLWQARAPGEERKAFRLALFAGVFAIGVYEHAALAVFAAACAALAGRLFCGEKTGAFPKLAAWLSVALLISFFAPGNFRRQAIRGIAETSGGVIADWLGALAAFAQSSWLAAAACCGLLAALLAGAPRESCPAPPASSSGLKRAPCLFLLLAAPPWGALLALGFALLHAQSECGLGANLKFQASLSLYLAFAEGATVFAAARLLARRRPLPFPKTGLPCLVIIICALCASGRNFRQTFENAANGQLALFGEFMERRIAFLRSKAAEAANADRRPKFGLAGELARPDARKPPLDAGLPEALVCRFAGSAFPVWMNEDLRGAPGEWPNKWAAWFYGLSSIRAVPAEFSQSLAQDELELAPPEALKRKGLIKAEKALTRGQGGGCDVLWLILEFSGQPPASLAVLRPNPLSLARLMPEPLQRRLLADFLARRDARWNWLARLTATRLHFTTKDSLRGRRAALPLAVAAPDARFPDPVFVSFGGGVYHRLQPYSH